ncbi:hypothetical protein SAMN05192575_101981 [Nocardioides alpinus]|uniref:Secreted protein n=1 Tax=Nocardioides alpinus TaxID=748909 RepID=A0A1I0WGX1_9ACTN|nr:hypothetical protein [Nocardioides alpinus]PKH37908.1 hypothetical protein CXG46_21220 [Nocardioides alpinus]SFA87637.1 hypothetical protein SAMN05192575_101981 [Nocardioides alpinus]
MSDFSRRTLVRGAAWAVPVISVAATVPAFAASRCSVNGGITVGPNTTTGYRAICSSQAQQSTPTTIKQVYGNGELPQYIDICTCDQITGWYRWRETDTLSGFQIEVDGLHVDQFGANQGYRPAVFLDVNPDGTGGCKRFALSYRTSTERSRTNRQNFSITWTLERSTGGQDGPWVQVDQFTRQVSIIRTTGTNNNDGTDFNQCSTQGRIAAGATD